MDNQIISALITVAGTLLGVWLGGRLSKESSMEPFPLPIKMLLA